MLLSGLVLIVAYANCLAGCVSYGSPGLLPGQTALSPDYSGWLEFGIAQALLGSGSITAAIILLSRPSWHIWLGAAVIGYSGADLYLAVISPGLAPPVGFLGGFVGGAFAIAWAGTPRGPRTKPVAGF